MLKFAYFYHFIEIKIRIISKTRASSEKNVILGCVVFGRVIFGYVLCILTVTQTERCLETF